MGHAGTPDPAGSVTYVVRDLAGNPGPGVVVHLNFSNCPGVRLASDVLAPGTYLDCANRTLYGVANMAGEVTFKIVGSWQGASSSSSACVFATMDGVPLPQPRVSTFDLDGINGVCAGDLMIWGKDFASGQNPSRSDYDFDGTVGAGDLAIWGKVFAGGGSAQSGAASCGP